MKSWAMRGAARAGMARPSLPSSHGAGVALARKLHRMLADGTAFNADKAAMPAS